jgi:hypothetical protein
LDLPLAWTIPSDIEEGRLWGFEIKISTFSSPLQTASRYYSLADLDFTR